MVGRMVSARRLLHLVGLIGALCIFEAWISIGAHSGPASELKSQPFSALPGRWVGKGRLGFKSGAMETIKCRATYFVENDGKDLRQNIRCASASGKVELKSQMSHDGKNQLTGTWRELLYNLEGQLTGSVTKRGFRIAVAGKDLRAHMEIAVKKNKQIVEVNFDSETLIGMTLLLTKG